MVLVTLLWTLLLRLFRRLFQFCLYSANLPCTFVLSLPSFQPSLPFVKPKLSSPEPPVPDGALGQVVPPCGLFLISSVSRASLKWADSCPYSCSPPKWTPAASLRFTGNSGWPERWRLEPAQASTCWYEHFSCSFTQRRCKWMQHTHHRWILWRL